MFKVDENRVDVDGIFDRARPTATPMSWRFHSAGNLAAKLTLQIPRHQKMWKNHGKTMKTYVL